MGLAVPSSTLPRVQRRQMLELDGLTRRYGDVVALDDLSFSVAPGRTLGFVGPNGAGKTTAMRIVLGVLAPDAGTVRWNGAPVDGATRARFGYMPEERGLYPKMRVRDQLVYFARLHALGAAGRRGRRRPLDRAARPGHARRRPRRDALARQPAARPARRRAGPRPGGAGARRAVLRPGPDRRRRDERRAARARGRRRARSSSPSHQLELVERLCEDVAIIKDGRLVASGAVDELRERGREEAEQVRVRVEGDGDGGWVAGVPGAEVAETGPRGVLVRLRGDADPDAVLDAARARRDRHALQPGAPDARRPLPPGGGRVSGARGRHARRPPRAVPAGAREELPDRHRRVAGDHRPGRRAAEPARLRRADRVHDHGPGPGEGADRAGRGGPGRRVRRRRQGRRRAPRWPTSTPR